MTGPLPAAPGPDLDHPSEPLAGVSLLVAAVTAVTGLLVAFGWHLTEKQAAAIVAVVGSLGSLVVWLWGRRKTYSPATVARFMAAKRTAGQPNP